jgi:hypothetical protein
MYQGALVIDGFTAKFWAVKLTKAAPVAVLLLDLHAIQFKRLRLGEATTRCSKILVETVDSVRRHGVGEQSRRDLKERSEGSSLAGK